MTQFFRLLAAHALVCVTCVTPVGAASTEDLQAARPDLFDPVNGYRVAKYRSPAPDDIPGPASVVTAAKIGALLQNGALAVDVYGAGQYARRDPQSGAWLISDPHLSLPGAVWLPEVGRGFISDDIARYLEISLDQLTQGDRDRAIIVFCRADCWMSWNAAQRVAAMGYTNVHWFPGGTDGWQDIGEPLQRVTPRPVVLDAPADG